MKKYAIMTAQCAIIVKAKNAKEALQILKERNPTIDINQKDVYLY